MDEQYISVEEAARRLEVTRTTVRNWCKQGLLRAVVPPSGRGFRVSEHSVATALQPVPVRRRSND